MGVPHGRARPPPHPTGHAVCRVLTRRRARHCVCCVAARAVPCRAVARPSYEPGKVITWWSVSSTTSDEQVARNFMAGCGGACTLLTIECETAMDVSALSFYSHEKESLLAPGTQLEILKRTRKGKVTEIHAREVGQAIS